MNNKTTNHNFQDIYNKIRIVGKAISRINGNNTHSGNLSMRDPLDPDSPDNGEDPDGSSEFCTIGSGPLNVFPGYYGWVSIGCGPAGDEQCSGVHWDMTGGALLPPTDNNGTSFTVLGMPGTSGRIKAYVNNDPAQSCFKPFLIGLPDCWEFT